MIGSRFYYKTMHAQPQWQRHVGQVAVTARLFCLDITTEQLTGILGLEPTNAQTAHEPARFGPGGLHGARKVTFWSYDTSTRIKSSDPNEHLTHLLDVFLPLKSRIEELRPLPHLTVSIYWESIIAGLAGPHIAAHCLSGLAALGASLEIKVAKIENLQGA